MSYTVKELEFPSSNGFTRIKAVAYIPDGKIKGFLQISHGMVENISRYADFMEFMAGNGFLCFGNDHIGHGKSAAAREDQGFFAEHKGYDYLVEDLDRLYELVKAEFGDYSRFLLGHSMGSFIVRLYEDSYPEKLSGLVISGTGGKNPLIGFGILLSKAIGYFKGSRYRSKFLDHMAFGKYNDRFKPNRTPKDWLTSENEIVDKFLSDENSNFIFTVSAFEVLFTLVKLTNLVHWFENYRKDLPIYMFSGEQDPVGDYGKGSGFVYHRLAANGVKDVTYKLYKGGRHEMLNEKCRKEIYDELLEWLNQHVDGENL